MLSYQHVYHAGGPADLHKHLLLVSLLKHLTAKPKPMTYMETHAGRGLYDLAGVEARKTGEAATGIFRLRHAADAENGADSPISWASDYLDVVRQFENQAPGDGSGQQVYPGSPLIAAELLRSDDALHLMELHPGEVTALRRTCRRDPRIHVHQRDGYEGVVAISPPTPRRGLVLIDPSYEMKEEYAQLPSHVARLLTRRPEAVVMIWFPLLPAGLHAGMVAAIEDKSRNAAGSGEREIWRSIWEFADKDAGRGMYGSGVLVLNPPWSWEDKAEAAFVGLNEWWESRLA